MYENTYMYAIERSPEYLAHYGVRGMKWGVRKARESGNSRKLGRQYRKALNKLNKLEKRATRGKNYAKRAAALGAGAAAAGGLAALGTQGVGNIMTKVSPRVRDASKSIGYGLAKIPGNNKVSQALRRTGSGMYYNAGKTGVNVSLAGDAVKRWGRGNSIVKKAGELATKTPGNNAVSQAVRRTGSDMYFGKTLKGVSNNTIARIGAGAVGAGLAAGAGYNAYRAATTKRAARKAAEFRSEMNKAFKGTQYENGGNRQGKKRKNRSSKA